MTASRRARRRQERAPEGAVLSGRVVVARRSGAQVDVALEVARGETLAILGPRGAGLSTLLGAIAGSVPLTGGELRIGEQRVSRRRRVAPKRRGTVLVDSDPRLFPHLTARENVAFGMRTRGVSRALARKDADEWLWRVGLPGLGDRRPRDLDDEQRLRAALARAFAARPQIVLLDDPVAGLEPGPAADVRALLHDMLVGTHATAVVAVHEAVDAVAVASRVVVVEDGRISQKGDLRHVLARPATPFVARASGLNRLRGTADRGGWVAESFGVPVRLDSAEPGPAPRDGEPIVAVFRPADAQIARAEEETWTGALRVVRGADEIDQNPEPGRWLARVERIEPAPGGALVHVAQPELAVDIPSAQLAALGIRRGDPVHVWVPAEAVRLIPATS
ncbi:ATP-binding cassette domain-containing protein [Microbacterium sp. gxy059]|uniref:ATP-binding cassette domain-containing protein n=1 Tax=Microbacterium sp. gxy059 TaxID=2957199 RepID=UPI003D96233C